MTATPRKPRRRQPCDEVEVPVARTNGHAGSAKKAAKGTDAERDSVVQVDVTQRLNRLAHITTNTPQSGTTPFSSNAEPPADPAVEPDACDESPECGKHQSWEDPEDDVQEEEPDFSDAGARQQIDGPNTESAMLAHINGQPEKRDAAPKAEPEKVQAADPNGEEWLTSDAYKHYTRPGCREERNRDFRPPSPPLWLCDYLRSREKADVLAAILYWFDKSERTGQPRARNRDKQGRRLIYKSQEEIADEAGIFGRRRREKIGRHLREFAKRGLLEYDGNSRQTKIWLVPSGIQNAYNSAPHHQE